ncbi:glycosyltransferase [Sphingomonas sp. H39-1-10]|uniref:glycosyltransferase n=1 Tax=Sphingomonas pollutisoli TaxID=3030829 RepID=UPI0023BA3BBE|nr:glycosyltransferase [Sphingomonas pollutisoli]MDF0488763.1 glycosyltransferase [Sphingomonas pollutisoli]
MSITREILDPGLVFLAAMSVSTVILMVMTIHRPFVVKIDLQREPAELALSMVACGVVASLATGVIAGSVLVTGVATLVTLGLRFGLPRLTMAGAQQLAMLPLGWIVGTAWTLRLLAEGHMPTWMMVLAVIASVFSAVWLLVSFAVALSRQALMTHREWQRPVEPADPLHPRRAPKVSIHLPCYAEPPEVVIATIDALAALDYPDYEILVIDNNTKDPALWMPVQDYCAKLNAGRSDNRFQFFHVAPLDGAKAGALNYLMKGGFVSPDAELIAVIDADYFSTPDFLSRLAAFFENPKIGYVQTPHDYREHEESAYLTACYWEYMPNNKIEMAGLSEYNSAITIGTMCIIRKQALIDAGLWAEWCLTEDSEVSVRIRALGYDGIYLRETFGRGLIPETFEDYKKQRFRWIAGPVQQLVRHWRLYLPIRWGGSPQINWWSKLLELQRGVEPLLGVFGTVFGFGSAIVSVTLIALGEVPTLNLPTPFWVAAWLALVGTLASTWFRYRLSDCHSIRDMVLGEIARNSLTWIQMLGGIAGLSPRPLGWRRTPKFQGKAAGMRALKETLPETLIGLAHIVLIVAALALRKSDTDDVGLLVAMAAAASGIRFLCAPLMAWLSEKRLAALAEPAASAPNFPASVKEAA